MDKIKRYIECYIPITVCNMKCHYCYITRQNRWEHKVEPVGHEPEEIKRALSKKRLGGACLINICGGGETLLCPDIVSVVRVLLEEGHYVMIVTNGTITNRLEEISEFPKDLLRHLIFKFSYHYLELKRLKLTEKFFNNIKTMRAAGASFTLELTPNDETIPYISDIKEEVVHYLGTLCHITIARDDIPKEIPILTKMSDEEFYKIWETFESDLLTFKKSIYGRHQGGFCYAGDWSLNVNLSTGAMSKCYSVGPLGNIYENIDKPLHFEAVGSKCPIYHCFNGHAYLSLGVIPELDTPTYASLRNRENQAGEEWLSEEMKSFLSGKLKDNNKEYSAFKKWIINHK